MRILALVTDAFGGFGGIAQYNRDFLKACAQAEDVEEIVTLPRLGALTDNSQIPNKVIQAAPRHRRVDYTWNALQVIRREGPFDVIFCGHLLMAPLAAFMAKRANAQLWLQLHGIEAWASPTRLVRWASQKANLVTAVSRYTRRRFLGWSNIPPERVRVLPNTIRTEYRSGPKPAYMLKRYRLDGHKVLLTVARLDKREQYKGHDRVIAILPRLWALYPKLRYVIAGDGDDRERLERLSRASGVDEIVQFIGDVPDDELPDLYRAVDVFVMPSTQEGFGIVFLEAAASGLPVIGGNLDGSIDALVDGELGIAVDPLSEIELENALIQALDRKRDPTGNVARFSFKNFAIATASLIAHLGNAAKRPTPGNHLVFSVY